MAEYISKEYIIDKCKEHRELYISAWGDFSAMPKEDKVACDAYATCWSDVVNAPSVDVQSVKHGYWYHNTSKYISELDACFIQACCSCCGRYSDKIDSYSQTMSNENCSHCGARMDGDKS
jgi:hypothetical protein